MFELLVLLGLIGAVVVLPLLLVGLALRIVFHLVLWPLGLVGALLGLTIAVLVLAPLALVAALLLGAVTLAGALCAGLPLLLLGLLVYGLVRLLRRERNSERQA